MDVGEEDANGGRTWKLTFVGDYASQLHGDVPSLQARHGEGTLTGTGAEIEIIEHFRGSFLAGSFTISFTHSAGGEALQRLSSLEALIRTQRSA